MFHLTDVGNAALLNFSERGGGAADDAEELAGVVAANVVPDEAAQNEAQCK